MKLKLPILFFAEEISGRQLVHDDECEQLEVTFYAINGIRPYDEDTLIYSNNEQFLCPLPIDQVERLIDKASINLMN